MAFDIHAIADQAEALFYERMLTAREREAAFRQCAEEPTATRVFRSDWTEVTMPLTYLDQDGERLLVRSQYDGSLRHIWEVGTWHEAILYRCGSEVARFRPHEWDESDRALGREW